MHEIPFFHVVSAQSVLVFLVKRGARDGRCLLYTSSVLGYVDTENCTYSDLTSEIHLNAGGISFSTASYVDLEKKNGFTGAFVADVKMCIRDRIISMA